MGARAHFDIEAERKVSANVGIDPRFSSHQACSLFVTLTQLFV